MENMQKRVNSMTVVIVKIIALSLMMLKVVVNWKKKTHQAGLIEIQIINKNIKGLNRGTIYRTFKTINENKGIQRRPGSGRKSTINKLTFKIIKKCRNR